MLTRSLLLALLVGCGKSQVGADTAVDTALSLFDTATGAETGATSGGDVAPPCADGWGLIVDPERAVHVSPGGSDGADGTAEAPLASLEAAAALAYGADYKEIALWPGSYPATSVALTPDPLGEGSLDGVAVRGCSEEEVTLEGISGESILKIQDLEGVELAGFTLSGGTQALWIAGEAEVTASQLVISGSQRVGVVVDGTITDPLSVTLDGVRVLDTVEETLYTGDVVGYGVLVEGDEVFIVDSLIQGSTTAGLVVHGGAVTLEAVDIADTAPDGEGQFGRGVQLQGSAPSLTMRGGSISGSYDAGLFALRPQRLELSGVWVVDTRAVTLDGGVTTGDGVVVSGLDEDGEPTLDPADFLVVLSGNLVEEPARAGIYLEHVRGQLDDNEAESGDGSCTLCYDASTTEASDLSGTDAPAALSGPLEIERSPPTVDGVGESR